MTTSRYVMIPPDLAPVAVAPEVREAAEGELRFIFGAAEVSPPRLQWWRPYFGALGGSDIELPLDVHGWTQGGGTINLTYRLVRRMDLADVVRQVTRTSRHEAAHVLEALAGIAPSIRVIDADSHGGEAGFCSHLARRWSRRRPSPEAAYLLAHPEALGRRLDQIETEIGYIAARTHAARAATRSRTRSDGTARPFRHTMMEW
jgi:hypothetical protein